MRAAVHYRYGEPELLTTAEIPDPVPGPGQCLIRIGAASLNPADWKYLAGHWRALTGNRFPRQTGIDFAGAVVTIGEKVSGFEPGDRVMGSVNAFRTGTAAEYAAVSASSICRIPDSLSYIEASGIPVAGGTAYMGLAGSRLDLEGRRILVTGSGGGVGHLAVQLARHLGAEVTAVCGPSKIEFSESLGAARVFDYTVTEPAQLGGGYSLIFDCATSIGWRRGRTMLDRDGEYILLDIKGRLHLFAAAAVSRHLPGPTMRTFLAAPHAGRCKELAKLFADGSLSMTVGGTYGLPDIAAAMRKLKDGHALGKIVVEL